MKHFLTAALFLATASALCSAQSDSPSLADVAKDNRSKKAALVVNEDTISSIGGTVSVVGTEPAPADNSVAAASAKAPAEKSSAASAKDSAQVKELKKQLDKDRQELNGWQQSAKNYQDMLANETSEFRRETYNQALTNDKTNITLTQKKIDDVQAQLAKAQQAGPSGQSTAGQTPANTQSPPSNQ